MQIKIKLCRLISDTYSILGNCIDWRALAFYDCLAQQNFLTHASSLCSLVRLSIDKVFIIYIKPTFDFQAHLHNRALF